MTLLARFRAWLNPPPFDRGYTDEEMEELKRADEGVVGEIVAAHGGMSSVREIVQELRERPRPADGSDEFRDSQKR